MAWMVAMWQFPVLVDSEILVSRSCLIRGCAVGWKNRVAANIMARKRVGCSSLTKAKVWTVMRRSVLLSIIHFGAPAWTRRSVRTFRIQEDDQRTEKSSESVHVKAINLSYLSHTSWYLRLADHSTLSHLLVKQPSYLDLLKYSQHLRVISHRPLILRQEKPIMRRSLEV